MNTDDHDMSSESNQPIVMVATNAYDKKPMKNTKVRPTIAKFTTYNLVNVWVYGAYNI